MRPSHQRLLDQGLQFHTLEPIEGGAKIHIYATDQATLDNIDEAAKAEGTPFDLVPGSGELIGTKLESGSDEEQRTDAQREYEKVIDQAQNTPGLEGRNLRETWKDAGDHWRSATGAAEGVGLRDSQGHPALISTRRVTVIGALESDHYRQAGLAALREEPDNFRRGNDLLRNSSAYPNLRPDEVEGKEPEEIARAAIDHVKSNLWFLYTHASDEVKEYGPHWYEGAHDLAADQAKKYKIPVQSAAGVFAALSPQKFWDMNVSLAERLIEIHQTKAHEPWDDAVTEAATVDHSEQGGRTQIVKSADQREIYSRIKGKQLSELTDIPEKALWIRIYDEAHNSTDYDRLSSDGRKLGTYTKERIDRKTHLPSGEIYNDKCNWAGTVKSSRQSARSNPTATAISFPKRWATSIRCAAFIIIYWTRTRPTTM
jgi:hypothetical protein